MSNTTNLQLSTPAHGANVDTWSQDPVNLNSGILDKAFGGVLSLTATSTTLGNTNAQNAVLKFTGTIAANITCTISGIIKTWTAINNTSGSFNVILATGSGKVVALPPGEPTDVFSDGTDFYFKGLDAQQIIERPKLAVRRHDKGNWRTADVSNVAVYAGIEITCKDNAQCIAIFDPPCSEDVQRTLIAKLTKQNPEEIRSVTRNGTSIAIEACAPLKIAHVVQC